MFTDTHSEVCFERGPDGRHLAVSRDIAASPDAAWEILTDTTYWPAWGPSVTGVDCADRVIRAGSRGRIETAFGMPLPFEITSCEDFRWTWDVANVSATGHRVEALDDGCRVVFEVPVLAAAYAPICQRALGEIERLAEG
ncbi:SRPBCC family protein [Haladaptatus sp. AB618]|uniref:SRPBCC family protein n=1 Tax=Haladaptatus sp. AB618 TaxID=2934173 RepID=UPI00209C32F3|nr:SRPBCC family protein [Haladaptatus sp. AB618]MCO8254362.1 SRPBCC family protein [Haladaptatus sp. AB618]